MSLFDVVAEKYEVPGRGSKRSKSTQGPLKELKERKEPRPSVVNLREFLGESWDEIASDPEQLETAERNSADAKQMESGVIPTAFTQTTDCKYCGPVYVPEGWPQPATNNCSWCMNRLKGLPIPGAT